MGKEGWEGGGWVYERTRGFEGLFHSTECYLVQPVGLEGTALGMVAEDGGDAVDTYFDGFFDKPFESGVVLWRGYGNMQLEGASAVVGEAFDNLHLAGGGVGVGNESAAHDAVASGDPDFVAYIHAENPDAVFGLVGGQGGIGALGVVGDEEVHCLGVFDVLMGFGCLGEAEAVVFHFGGESGLLGEDVGGGGIGEEVEAFDAFGSAVDVEVGGGDDPYLVVVAEIGIAAGLGKEVEAESGVVPLYGEHGKEGGAEVNLHGKAVEALGTEV